MIDLGEWTNGPQVVAVITERHRTTSGDHGPLVRLASGATFTITATDVLHPHPPPTT